MATKSNICMASSGPFFFVGVNMEGYKKNHKGTAQEWSDRGRTWKSGSDLEKG